MLVYVIVLGLCMTVCGEYPDDVSLYCTQTARNSLEATPRKITPVWINGTVSLSNSDVSQLRRVHLSLCPDIKILKLDWIIDSAAATNLTLCYTTHKLLTEDITNCYAVPLIPTETAVLMDCWFPSFYADGTVRISARVAADDRRPGYNYFGDLTVANLDTDNSCDDVCETSEVTVHPQIHCQTLSSVSFIRGVNILSLVFDASRNAKCANNTVEIVNYTENSIEYHLQCPYQGEGYLKVLFSVKSRYCIKYQPVTVVCTNAEDSDDNIEETHSFGAFMIFAVICVVVISLIIVATILIAQRVMEPWRKYCKPHFQCCCKAKHQDKQLEEQIPLRATVGGDSQPSSSVADTVTPISRTTKNRERFENDQLSLELWEAWRQAYLKRIRRSITRALLEDIDPLYKKKILFLPIPFDHYSRDATFLLKRIFTKDAGIISQCCFDRDVYSQYVTGDRYKWMENILGDHDRILIFLCFTSLCNNAKYDDMVQSILHSLLLTRVMSHRLCKVFFLHLIDNRDNIRRNHHGEHFHIGSETDYFEFVSSVLSYCGRNSEETSDLKQRVSTCKHSKQFLQLIGVCRKVAK